MSIQLQLFNMYNGLNNNREQKICHEYPLFFYYKTVHISMLTICTQLYEFKNTIKTNKQTNRQ